MPLGGAIAFHEFLIYFTVKLVEADLNKQLLKKLGQYIKYSEIATAPPNGIFDTSSRQLNKP